MSTSHLTPTKASKAFSFGFCLSSDQILSFSEAHLSVVTETLWTFDFPLSPTVFEMFFGFTLESSWFFLNYLSEVISNRDEFLKNSL